MWDLETIVRMNAPKSKLDRPGVGTSGQPKTEAPKAEGVTATYRIHTEDINRKQVIELAGKRFDGFTVSFGIGHYKGDAEFSLILEIITSDAASIYLLAEEIRKANGQESVLVNRIESSALSVQREGLISL